MTDLQAGLLAGIRLISVVTALALTALTGQWWAFGAITVFAVTEVILAWDATRQQ